HSWVSSPPEQETLCFHLAPFYVVIEFGTNEGITEMTDPEAAKENEETEVPPPQPPRPAPGASGLSQLESDERYARQLAEHYERSGSFGGPRQARPYARTRDPGPGETNLKPNELYGREHSFLDDDLPVIRDNLRKGFHE